MFYLGRPTLKGPVAAGGPFHCPENRISSFPRRRESRWGFPHVLLGQADFEKALSQRGGEERRG